MIFSHAKVLITQFKGTHRENTHSNKTKALTKSMSMRIWEIGTLNELFIYIRFLY